MGERRWGNFSSCCRLCLSEKLGTLKSIFEDAARSRDMVKNIQASVGVEVKASDRLSTMICEQCLTKVNGWYSFKKTCSENQSKLVGWMQAWNANNLADMSIQIKDEVVEDGEGHSPPPQIILDDDDDDVVRVKAEVVQNTYEPEPMEEDIYDLPPPLTPHPPDEQIRALTDNEDDDDDDDQRNNLSNNTSDTLMEVNGFLNFDSNDVRTPATPRDHGGKNCLKCGKSFSSVGNRRKHEAMIHRRPEQAAKRLENEKAAREKKDGVLGTPSSRGTPTTTRSENASSNETDVQKIQFAAGLQLQQRSANSEHSENMPLTKVEVSYLEKYKTIVKMTETLVCACHNEKYEEVRELHAHLKKTHTWFAMFTCYNCLITFGDRSSYMKHFCHCPKDLLQNLKRLSESPVNPEIKMRLYQSFKCIRCGCIFSFHEDFCSHFDVEHMEMLQDSPPYTCLCTQSFNEVEDYKQHLHITCFLRYFCDICFEVFPSTDAFKAHCEKTHDNAEGDSIDSFDYFHKCRQAISEVPVQPKSSSSRRSAPLEKKVSEETEETRSSRRRTIALPISSGRKTPPQLEVEDPDYSPEANKVINPHALHSNIKSSKPTACPACGKMYSSYHNMLRHYKLSHDKTGKILKCSYCQEKFRLITELKEHEGTVHSLLTENNVNENGTNQSQFNFSCPDCGKLFKDMNDWTKHVETHPKKSCVECGKQFMLQSELDQHRSAHLNIKVYRDAKTQDYKSAMISPILICEICDKTFNTKSELRQHKLLHEKMPVLSAQDGENVVEDKKDLSRKYSCIPCNKHYVSYGGIWDHNKKHHPDQQIVREYPKQCTLCPKVLTSRGAWSNHERMHERLQSQGITYTKTPEKYPPANRPRTPKMKKTDDDESYYTCKRCFKVFSSKYNYRNHMKCHGINLNPSRSSSKTGKIIKTYWCDVCHQACPGYAELQEHKREHLNENMPNLTSQVDPPDLKTPFVFTCDICTQTFPSNFALRRHREKHAAEQGNGITKPSSVYCKYCKIPFPDAEDLNEHMANEHEQSVTKSKPNKSQGRKFPCGLCKKVFDNAGALSSHQGWHKRGKVEKRARSQEKLFRTMVNQIPKSPAPPETTKYQCYSCSLHFVNDTALQIHILETHRNINTTVLAMNCNSCKMSFDSKSAYDTHMQLHQVVENQRAPKPHPCKYCPAGFSRSDTLNGHVRQHHKEHYRDTFKCNQCDRVFDKQNALTIHLKVHDRQRLSGDNSPPKPVHNKNIYFCSICDLGFVIAKDLRNHVVTAHPF